MAPKTLCATVGFASIESANVVGYQTKDIVQGTCMYTASFKAIEGDYKISDIKVEGALAAGGESAQLINTDGTWGQMYVYLTEDEAFVPDGWYKDMGGEEAATDDDVLTIGQAFIFTCDSDVTFTVAGQVIQGQPTVTVETGNAMVGNPTPVAVKVSEIEVIGAVGAGGESAQKINVDGSWGQMYVYLTEDEAFVPDGWYKDMGGEEPVSDEDILDASESMIFTTDSDIEVKFPAAL